MMSGGNCSFIMKVILCWVLCSLVISQVLSATLRQPSDDQSEVEIEIVENEEVTRRSHPQDNPLKAKTVKTRAASQSALKDAEETPRTNGQPRDPDEISHRRLRREALSKSPIPQLAVNCREVVIPNISDPVACSSLTMADILRRAAGMSGFTPYAIRRSNEKEEERPSLPLADRPSESTDRPPLPTFRSGPKDVPALVSSPDSPFYANMVSSQDSMTGLCRYDPYRGAMNPAQACVCVATRETCTTNRDSCHWHKSYNGMYGECISSSERVYNQLAALLKKRGKTDLDINIKYGSTGARGQLPYGPLGPAIIGDGYNSFTAKNPELAVGHGLFGNAIGQNFASHNPYLGYGGPATYLPYGGGYGGTSPSPATLSPASWSYGSDAWGPEDDLLQGSLPGYGADYYSPLGYGSPNLGSSLPYGGQYQGYNGQDLLSPLGNSYSGSPYFDPALQYQSPSLLSPNPGGQYQVPSLGYNLPYSSPWFQNQNPDPQYFGPAVQNSGYGQQLFGSGSALGSQPLFSFGPASQNVAY